jgi:hypothetical protein
MRFFTYCPFQQSDCLTISILKWSFLGIAVGMLLH